MRRAFGRCCLTCARRMPGNAPRRSKRFKSLPEAVAPFMAALLGDADADVRLLATELARNMPPNDATRVLCGLLEKETASQRLRGRRRGAGRGRNPRCRAGVEGLRRAVCGRAVPAVRHIDHHRADFEHRKLIPDGASRSSGRTLPSTSRRTMSGGSANFSIAAPACHSTTTSATSSTAVSPSGSPRPGRARSSRILPCCDRMPSTRSSIWSTPSR